MFIQRHTPSLTAPTLASIAAAPAPRRPRGHQLPQTHAPPRSCSDGPGPCAGSARAGDKCADATALTGEVGAPRRASGCRDPRSPTSDHRLGTPKHTSVQTRPNMQAQPAADLGARASGDIGGLLEALEDRVHGLLAPRALSGLGIASGSPSASGWTDTCCIAFIPACMSRSTRCMSASCTPEINCKKRAFMDNPQQAGGRE